MCMADQEKLTRKYVVRQCTRISKTCLLLYFKIYSFENLLLEVVWLCRQIQSFLFVPESSWNFVEKYLCACTVTLYEKIIFLWDFPASIRLYVSFCMQFDEAVLLQPSAKKRKVEDEEPLHNTPQNGKICYCSV